MRFNIDQNREIDINNKHEIFEGSEFENQDFCVYCKPLSQVKISDIRKRHTTTTRSGTYTDEMAVDHDISMFTVQRWEGIDIVSKDGNVNTDCSNENKDNLAKMQYG